MVELGGVGVHVPYHITWEHEAMRETEGETAVYHTLTNISQLPKLVAHLTA